MDKKIITDTIPIRKGEELNERLLEELLRRKLPDLSNEQMIMEQFSAGSSNLTYLIRIGKWEGVLRRAPLGPVNTKAHDMNREFRVLRAISPVFKLAPKPYFFVEDEKVIGAPFYLMERLNGVLLEAALPDKKDGTETVYRKISNTMVDTLVKLHKIDYKNTELVKITRPEGFLERQVKGWIGRYKNVETNHVPGMEQLIKWITMNMPVSQEPTFIHYDFHLKNILFSNQDISRISAVLDWEMSTVGDPLTDLASALVLWHENGDPDFFKFQKGTSPITTRTGFISRQEFIEAYSVKSGRDVSKMNYYIVFGYFKHIVIMQQMYYRWKKGQTKDIRFEKLDVFVKNLTDWALENTVSHTRES
ncbi:phosphotransferase family protein [Mesobacillus harenae]|uniref:phosphotransferase family protein n=1 Tax=Mesobacillus harenae TaxID=2213203 RepID=UPI001580D4FD|nr:phosphotransferase family protein [Mesobacillus harenae]